MITDTRISINKKDTHPERITKLIFSAFLLLISLFIFFINIKMPLVGEDYSLQPWNYNKSPATIIGKIDLIFDKVYLSATMWSARIGEALSTITAAFPPLVFDIINTLFFIWLIYILFVLVYGRFPISGNPQDGFAFFSIIFLIITLFPLLGQIFFWKAGTSNHIWGLILLLSFTLPFRMSYRNNKFILSTRSLLIFVLLGFFAGLSVENAAVVVFGFLLLYYIILVIKKQLDKKYMFPLISFGIGLSILLFSPSTSIRRNYYNSLGIDGNFRGLSLYLHRIIRIGYDFLRLSWPLILIFLGCLLTYLILKRSKIALYTDEKQKGNSPKLEIVELVIILFIASLSILPLISIAYQSDQRRGFALFWLILIGIIAFLMTEIWVRLPSLLFRSLIILILLGLIVPQMLNMGIVYTKFYSENNQRMEIIYTAIKEGNSTITLPAITVKDSRIIETREILPDLGSRIAMYFGFESVIIQK